MRAYEQPALWMTKQYGFLTTRRGPRHVSECAAPDLDTWADVLTIAECPSDTALALDLPTDLSELSAEMWDAAFETTDRLDEDLLLGTFYAAACLYAEPPEMIRCRVGRAHQAEARSAVSVVTERRELDALIPQGVRCCWFPEGKKHQIWSIAGVCAPATPSCAQRSRSHRARPTRPSATSFLLCAGFSMTISANYR